MSLLANCTSMPSGAPSVGLFGRGVEVVCTSGAPLDDGDLQSVVVKYVYKVESKGVSSASEFLPELEEKILSGLNDMCGGGISRGAGAGASGASDSGSSGSGSNGSGSSGIASIESYPEDIEITTGENFVV